MDRSILFLAFFGTMFTLFGLMQYRLVRAFRKWVRYAIEPGRKRRWNRTGLALLTTFNLIFILRFFLSEFGLYDHPLSQSLLVYPGGIFFAIVVLGFLVLALGDLYRFTQWVPAKVKTVVERLRGESGEPADPDPVFQESRRTFLKRTGLTGAAAVSAFPVLSSIASARDYQVNRIPLRFPHLPPELEGFTIAQISDIHSGMYMTEQNMREIFDIVNGLQANLIVITGDFVDNADSQIAPLATAVGMLNAEYGVYGCLGNHDHFATAERVNAALESKNIVMLNNSHRLLPVDRAPFALVGVDDFGKRDRNFAQLDRALAGLDPATFKILLTHRPEMFPAAKEAGIDLTLAGHTHGGQVGIELGPINLNPVYLVHEYARGLYKEDGKIIYVNVGVGMVGVPIRLVRPEISVFSLWSYETKGD